MNNQILFASSNMHKINEMKLLFEKSNWKIISPSEINIPKLEVIESGSSYLENAVAKIIAYENFTTLPILADDSGLEVDALNGYPGIFSARMGGQNVNSDTERNEHLLTLLNGIINEDRSAIFRAILVIKFFGGDMIVREGKISGEIICKNRGNDGFGYDPIFELVSGETMAEIGNRKNDISHRAKAAQALIYSLKNSEKDIISK
ncbi:MAG: non-canonical purine NTP pyrophosphatase [Dehalococcoidia bacterium]